jgi:hypothetical protein
MMTIKLIDLASKIFKIANENEDIILKIEYGEAQPGQASIVELSSPTSSILIRQTKDTDSEDEFNLGKGRDIKNQNLYINTYLGDSLSSTDKVSATYTFTNGTSPEVFPPYSYTVDNGFDSIVLRLIFFLQK